MMRRSLLIATVMLAIFAITFFCLRSTKAADPIYKGKHLSDWIDAEQTALSALEVTSEAEEACRALGPTAVPLLVERLKHGTSSAEKSYALFWTKLPLFLSSRLPQPEDQIMIVVRRIKAIRLLTRMGHDGQGAIPALAEVVQQGDVFSRSAAATALGDLDQATPEAIQALKQALRSNDLTLCSRAAVASWKLNPADEDAFSQVKQLLLFKERYDGSQTPRDFNSHRVLIPSLLGDMGPKAKKAAPILKQILSEEGTGEVYSVVKNALKKIDPPAGQEEP